MDLKIKDVSDLLSVSEATIRRWITEGSIPAYKLNRQYRFNRAEIEDWMLRKKLDLPSKHSAKETESFPNSKQGPLHFSLYRAIYRGEVYSSLKGESKEEIIRAVMEPTSERYDLDPDVLSELFLDREHLMPTSIGQGIAVPHTRDFLLPTHFDVINVVFPQEPLSYGALDGVPVHTLFFLFACEDKHHLHLLAKIAHLVSSNKTREFLQTAPSKEVLLEYIKEWESALTM